MNSPGETHRSKALIVKIIGQSVRGQRLQPCQGLRGGFRCQVTHDDNESVATEVLRTVSMGQPPDRLEFEAGLAERAGRPVLNRQVLDGLRMPVLETAIADAMARQIPAPADRLHGLDGSQAALGQAIEVETPLGRWLD